MNDYTIEKITWLDSMAGSGWKFIKDFQDGVSMECESIGYVIAETDKYIIIAPHYHSENDDAGAIESVCGEMSIPKCSILERKELIDPTIQKITKRQAMDAVKKVKARRK